MRVLIVEDEPNLGRQLRSTLEGAGYAVDLATDGEDGHYLGSTEQYDAVVLDLGLPEIDGLTVLDRWRKEGRAMPLPQIERRVLPRMGGADYLGPELRGRTLRMKFMDNGKVIWVDVDPRTGRILGKSGD